LGWKAELRYGGLLYAWNKKTTKRSSYIEETYELGDAIPRCVISEEFRSLPYRAGESRNRCFIIWNYLQWYEIS
jgi:hypothetical protein